MDVGYLVVTQPDSIIQKVEADDMIMEGFTFGMPPGSGEALREHLLHQLKVRLLVKGRVKTEHRP